MKYLCGGCGKGFDVVATLESRSVVSPSVYPSWEYPNHFTVPQHTSVTYSNYQTETLMKKPCCPFCGSLEFEEAKAE